MIGKHVKKKFNKRTTKQKSKLAQAKIFINSGHKKSKVLAGRKTLSRVFVDIQGEKF